MLKIFLCGVEKKVLKDGHSNFKLRTHANTKDFTVRDLVSSYLKLEVGSFAWRLSNTSQTKIKMATVYTYSTYIVSIEPGQGHLYKALAYGLYTTLVKVFVGRGVKHYLISDVILEWSLV